MYMHVFPRVVDKAPAGGAGAEAKSTEAAVDKSAPGEDSFWAVAQICPTGGSYLAPLPPCV